MTDQDLQQRVALTAALRQHLEDQPGTQATKARALRISQPRFSDLMRGKTDKFSLDALVLLSQRAGLRLNVNAQSVRLPRRGGPRIEKTRGESPFPVNPIELGRFEPNDAPRLLLTLLRCEVFAVGLSPKDVVLSHATTAADGGIDAKVVGVPSSGGLMSQGSTHFQVKTGTSFKPWQESSLKKELFGSSRARPSRKALGSAVRECLDSDGVYCLVTFGHDLLPDEHGRSAQALTKLFQACGYPNPRVTVIGQGQLAGEIERYPSIYLDLFGFEDDFFLSLRAWQAKPSMRQPLALGNDQKLFVEEVRKICTDGTAAHLRVVGEPGIGKTRLLSEALSDDAIAASVIYVPTGEDFQKSRLFKEVLRSERSYSLTLVIDDCEERDRVSIWGALRGVPSIKLITVDHGLEHGVDSAMRVLQCPRLPSEQIEAILKQYIGARPDDARKWAEICDGSPRVAHAVGENLKENPGDLLRAPSSVPLWDRYITGYAKASDATAEQYKLVLRHIALFTRFGFETPVSEEGRFVAELVREADPSITYAKFQAIVQHFRERRILQGRHTLFLVPKALHIYLLVDFWNQHGRGFDFVKFFERIPQGMQDWFLRLFTYAHDPAPALAVVKTVAGPSGPFKSPEFASSETGARLLRYLAEADAAATLACIERTHGQRSHAELLAWRTGRQDIVWALEKVAVWNDCFERAVRVLAKMAVAENANNSNNSKGTLCDLFSIGLGWAPTQAAPTKRFPILAEFLTSRDESLRELGLELAKSWLSTRGGSRIVGAEHQGLRPTLEFWRPKTYGEVYDAWRRVWKLLETEAGGAEGHWRERITETLIEAADGLIPIDALATQILDTLFALARADFVNKRSLVALVIRFLRSRHENLPDETLARIRDLDALITGSSLWDRISRHVLNSNWDEDYAVEGEKVIESNEPKTRVEQLSRELMKTPDTLATYATRLMGTSGHRLPHLGVACGRLAIADSWDFVLLRELSHPGQAINGEFLGGYFAGIRELNSERWENNLLSLLNQPALVGLGIDCMMRSGVNDKILKKLEQLYLADSIDTAAFDRLVFRLGGTNVSEPYFLSAVDALLTRRTNKSASVAVGLLREYYLDESASNRLPRAPTLRALVTAAEESDERNPMAAFNWGGLAQAFIARFPEDTGKILRALLTSETLMSDHTHSAKVAETIIKTNPRDAWRHIAELLESENLRRYDVVYWLSDQFGHFGDRERIPPVVYLPVDAVIDWAKKDPERRAIKVLQILPKTVDPHLGGTLTVRFIEEFCNTKEMAGSLEAHFWTGSWSGPESLYLEKKRDTARQWLASSQSDAVVSWLSQYITHLNADVETAKIRQEREF